MLPMWPPLDKYFIECQSGSRKPVEEKKEVPDIVRPSFKDVRNTCIAQGGITLFYLTRDWERGRGRE